MKYKSLLMAVILGGMLPLVGCGGGDDRLTQLLEGKKSPVVADLENSDPLVRIEAIKWAGDHNVREAVPVLVDRLQEDDPAMRFYAIEALKKITGGDQGYDYKADAVERRKAVARWRAFSEQTSGDREKREKGS